MDDWYSERRRQVDWGDAVEDAVGRVRGALEEIAAGRGEDEVKRLARYALEVLRGLPERPL